jgi:predicted CXXCH cytochrome family protein
MKRAVLINLALLMLIPLAAQAQEERVLNILYTGSLQGELEPCGCSPKTDFGGVARLSGYLERHKKELSPYILVDAGNFSGEDTPQGRLKTETLLKAFGIMGYDAVAFLKREEVFPVEFLSSLPGKYEVPVVSNSPPYEKGISVNSSAFNIHIGTEPGDFRKDKLNILLTDIPVSEAKGIKGWDVIIDSSGEILDDPLRANGTIIVTGYPKGKRTGVLTLEFDGSKKMTGLTHRWLLLGEDAIEDARVRRLLKEYDDRVSQLLKEDERPVTENSYLGVSKCAECHQLFVESWEKTKHARAFSDLQQVGKSFDPECVICHTVGFGEEGGFYSIKATPGLANVQCEVCHGSGRAHLSDIEKPLKPVTASVCLTCHTKDRSPDFDYPAYLEKIRH